MGNASLGKFAINRKTQVDKDTIKVDDLMYHPIAYGGGFNVLTETDTFGDLVESKFENSRVDILSAVTAGEVAVPATTDMLALIFSMMLGTIVSTALVAGQNFATTDVNTTTDVITITSHGRTTGDPVRFSSSGTLPSGLTSGTKYFVRSTDANTLTVHTTETGAINNTGMVDLATQGSGTHTLQLSAYSHVITPSTSGDPKYHTVLYHDGTVDCRVVGAVATALGFECGFQSKRMNMGASFTGILRETNGTSYPTNQIDLNPLHFTASGADLKLYKDGVENTDYNESRWAGLAYSLQDAISAEHRAGSNAFEVIQRLDRGQTLALVLDYYDATFKNLLNDYQTDTSPAKWKVDFTLKGRPIDAGGTQFNQINMVFYNCNVLSQGYSMAPEIQKQSIPFSVNYDADTGKSVQVTIQNDIPGYLT